jgi:hypothetical protein
LVGGRFGWVGGSRRINRNDARTEALVSTINRQQIFILETSLIPAADELDKAALAKLDSAYIQQKINVASTAVWLHFVRFRVKKLGSIDFDCIFGVFRSAPTH